MDQRRDVAADVLHYSQVVIVPADYTTAQEGVPLGLSTLVAHVIEVRRVVIVKEHFVGRGLEAHQVTGPNVATIRYDQGVGFSSAIFIYPD